MKREQRRLAAIVVADVVGYSRLVGQDEEGTLQAFRGHRADLFNPLIAEHNGRVANTAGDSFLVEFPSVVDAVRCAAAIQEGLAVRNQDTPAERRIVLRIGINLGDVIADGDDLLGDGVNIAARLEALCSPGGMMLSDDAFRQVRDRLDLAWVDAGLQKVKNIARPIQVWRWTAAGDGLSRDSDPPDQPEAQTTPSIAVLPFDYLGAGKAENGYLADGLSEIIIASLAQIPRMDVIARNSSFIYKDQAVDVREVAQNLNVRFVLEGSVQLAGSRMRTTAQLVDGKDGKHIWAKTYDKDIDDIFAVQDAISLAIVREIYGETMVGKQSYVASTNNLQAWSEEIKGNAEFNIFSSEANNNARQHFLKAIDLDPNFAGAYGRLAMTHFIDARLGFGSDPEKSIKQAEELAEKALSLNPGMPGAMNTLAFIKVLQARPEEAISLICQALDIAPNDQFTNSTAAWVYKYTGDARKSLPYFDKARRLYPIEQAWLIADHFGALINAGETATALDLMPKIVAGVPVEMTTDLTVKLAVVHYREGNLAAAKKVVEDALEAKPGLSIAGIRHWDIAYIDRRIPEQNYAILRELGVPED